MKALMLVGVLLLAPAQEWWEEEREAQAGGGLAETKREANGASRIDWEEGILEAVGLATCDPATALSRADCYRRALTAARVLAYQKLAETLHGVAVDGHTIIANELMENSRLKTATRGVLSGARVVDEAKEDMPDGSILARVLVRLALYPAREESTSVVGALLPTLMATGDDEPPFVGAGGSWALSGPATGLILDATGLGARPALSPSVVADGGGIVYGRSVADSSAAGSAGLVAYTSSVERARRLEHRVGETPLVVGVVRADGPTRADLVLKADDAALVATADREEGFLARCSVAVVLD